MPLSKARQAQYMRELRARQSVIPKVDAVIPKYDIGYMYPDGRCRLEDMTVVQPSQCLKIRIR